MVESLKRYLDWITEAGDSPRVLLNVLLKLLF